MTRHATRWVAGGTLAVALLIPGLVLGAGQAGAGVAVKAFQGAQGIEKKNGTMNR